MKIEYVFLSIVLAIAFSLTVFGQQDKADMTKSAMKYHDMSGMMGKPTVELTVDELHMKVWLMTQQEHKKLMEEMMVKNPGMKMNKTVTSTMIAGTHHIMLVLRDNSSEEDISLASANILIVSPSDKSTSVDLNPVMNHFGGALILDESGKYQLKVNVIIGGVTRSAQFQYVVE